MARRICGSFLWSAVVLLFTSTGSIAAQAQVRPERPPFPDKNRELHGKPSIAAPERTVPLISNPALKLTDAQRAQIDGIVADYINQEKALHQQVVAQRSMKRADGEIAKKRLRQNFNAAVNRVLNGFQRKVWEDSLAERGFGPDGVHGVPRTGSGGAQPAR